MVKPLWIDSGGGLIRNPDIPEAEFQAGLSELRDANVAALWEAAHNYEFSEISGSAIGLLTMGVSQSKPKCQAVMAWIQSIWALYYERKALVTHEWDASLMDFSGCGPMPHTVPELIAEVQG